MAKDTGKGNSGSKKPFTIPSNTLETRNGKIGDAKAVAVNKAQATPKKQEKKGD